MKWLNALWRSMGFPEKPSATSGITSVLFVLQSSKSPLSFYDLCEKTKIRGDDLLRVLNGLEREGRVTSIWEGPSDSPYRSYSIVRKKKG